MSNPIQVFGRFALSWLLILQIALGSSILAFAGEKDHRGDPGGVSAVDGIVPRLIEEGQSDPAVEAGRARAEALVAEIEAAGPTDLPRKTPDTFHLTGQTLETASGEAFESHDLSSFRVELPSVIADFDREIGVELNPQAKTFSIVRKKGGRVVARHTIPGFEIVAFARDKEMLQLVDASGKLFVLDMVFARNAAFKMPLPVFEVGQLPSGKMTELAQAGAPLQAVFTTRGTKPPAVIPEDAILPTDVAEKDLWTAGDLMLFFEKDGKRTLVGVYNRGVSQMQMYTGNAVLSFLGAIVSPPESDAALKSATAPLADPVVAQAASRAQDGMDAPTRDALAAFSKKAVENLRRRSATNVERAGAMRDRFLYEEWTREFAALRSRAQGEIDNMTTKQRAKNPDRGPELERAIQEGDLSGEWQGFARDAEAAKIPTRSMFYRLMTSKAMKYMAGLAAGSAAVGEFLNLAHGNGPAWAVHVANVLYSDYWPAVLKDASYRMTLLKSSLALSAFMPALYAVGTIYGNGKNWIYQKALSTIGIRIYAALQLPFLARIAKAAFQPNFIPALTLGVNPFSVVSKDSAAGRKAGLTEDVRPGLVTTGLGAALGAADNVSPEGQSARTTARRVIRAAEQARERDIAVKRKVLEAIATQKNRLRAYSWLLANMVVAEKHGLDPATMLLAQTGRLEDGPAKGDVLQKLNDPEFQKEWSKIAHELVFALEDLKSGALMDDVSQIPPEQIAADFEVAKKTAAVIEGRSGLKKIAAELRTHWRELGSRARKAVGNFGQEEYLFLRDVEPSKFVYESTWRQFVIDYGLAIAQMAVVGGRADLAKPGDLAADARGDFWSKSSFAWTNKKHFGDMGEQVAIYGVSVPAGMSQNYQKDAQPTEDLYDPVEKISMAGDPRPESVLRGIWNWMKAAGHLREANYGMYFFKGLTKKMRSIQAAMAMSLLCRHFLAGQTVGQAFSAFIYVTIWGNWAYGWLWQPVNRGNQIYEERLEALNGEFLEAKSKIGQGVRVGDRALIDAGYRQLSAIYRKHYNEDLPKQLRKDMARAEALLNVPHQERLAWLEGMREFYGPVAGLSQALSTGDASRIQDAYERLRAQYKGESGARLSELNARSLLEYALANPPFHNKAHPFVTWFSTFAGSVLTTYWATALFVSSYNPTAMSLGAILHIGKWSALLYGGTYYGQKLVNRIWDAVTSRIGKSKAQEKTKTEARIAVPEAFDEYLRQYVAAKAEKFKADPRDVQALLGAEAIEALRRKHAEEIERERELPRCAEILLGQ